MLFGSILYCRHCQIVWQSKKKVFFKMYRLPPVSAPPQKIFCSRNLVWGTNDTQNAMLSVGLTAKIILYAVCLFKRVCMYLWRCSIRKRQAVTKFPSEENQPFHGKNKPDFFHNYPAILFAVRGIIFVPHKKSSSWITCKSRFLCLLLRSIFNWKPNALLPYLTMKQFICFEKGGW